MKFFYILVLLLFILVSCSSGSTEKYINKETLLTKGINHLQINELSSYEYVEIKKIIKFDWEEIAKQHWQKVYKNLI